MRLSHSKLISNMENVPQISCKSGRVLATWVKFADLLRLIPNDAAGPRHRAIRIKPRHSFSPGLGIIN